MKFLDLAQMKTGRLPFSGAAFRSIEIEILVPSIHLNTKGAGVWSSKGTKDGARRTVMGTLKVALGKLDLSLMHSAIRK